MSRPVGRSRNRLGDQDEAAAHREASVARTMAGLVPLAVALLLLGALVWWLLDRHSPAAAWLVAGVLVAHGWVHLVFLIPSTQRPTAQEDADNPFDMERSWLIARGVDRALIRRLGVVVAVGTCAALVAAGLAVLGWLVPTGWWAALVTTAVVGSTTLLVLFFAPGLVLGFVINAGLLALVLQSSWPVHR